MFFRFFFFFSPSLSLSSSRRGLSSLRPCLNATTTRASRTRRRALPDRLLLQLRAPRLARVRVGADLLPSVLEPRELARDEAEARLHCLDGLVGLLPDERRADELEDAVFGFQGLELLLLFL